MRVLITGAGGFLGRTLTRTLLADPLLTNRDGVRTAITELVLADRGAIEAPRGPMRAEVVQGDLADRGFALSLAERGFDSVFHLAASLTLEAERDPDPAFAINVDAVRHLIAGTAASPPRIVFTSSIAVFGGKLPDIVDDAIRPTPTTTYGTHKAVVELLLADATRLGRMDGRALRLPIVLTRPGAPMPAVSDRVAAILREPLAGRDVVCPLTPQTRIPVASVGAVARALLKLHELPAAALPSTRAMNLPALTVSIAEMVAALETHGSAGRRIGTVTYEPDPTLQGIVDGWPKRFVSEDASGLGLGSDPDLRAVIDDYLSGQAGAHAAC